MRGRRYNVSHELALVLEATLPLLSAREAGGVLWPTAQAVGIGREKFLFQPALAGDVRPESLAGCASAALSPRRVRRPLAHGASRGNWMRKSIFQPALAGDVRPESLAGACVRYSQPATRATSSGPWRKPWELDAKKFFQPALAGDVSFFLRRKHIVGRTQFPVSSRRQPLPLEN